ncbi:glycoside hydrolase family 2 protein [Loktanella sp. S4079]|uniref:glycoside hydrolase family 2 protein n=1 Tax=Loktanella sp. S4079 TaxID=579483 RepID=UPI0005FA2BA7|nr:glycoside hydrolase family 2 protein [Loktanella sp. S4079]KJZ18938.1 beta-mannosidase [Loktanella sp. S4079]
MTQLSLAGEWSLSDDSGDYTCAMHLPTDGITALHEAGLIADPYWGRNEYDLRWICERDWTVSRHFDVSEIDIDLVLSEVDTVVTVRVNDQIVLKAENAFRTYRVPLSEFAKVGTNTISITFHSPVVAGGKKQAAHPFPLPISKNCPIPDGNMLRKPACDFGWDWNIALAPFGIYGTMAIEPSKVARIERLAVTQDHSEGAVALGVTVYTAHHDGEVSVSIAGQTVSGTVDNGCCDLSIQIDNPDLWWPADQGDQPLYDLTVTAGSATAHRRIGLRKLELITEKDDAGMGFKFRINGRDVFCKGANWIPADALPGQITEEKTRDLLQSAVDANMNMVRIWGGGRYEPTSFYDACDELGLLVWQDFMFACNLYPSDNAYLDEVRAEIKDNVARMHHHASIAVWCGDNELIGALGWYDCSINDRDRYLVNYDRLNRAIETQLLETDPTAIWWPSSPSPGPMNFGDAWHDDGSGDMHFWSVWHEGRDFEHYRDVSPRFCSEFGFQSYPSMNAIRKFAGEADQNIAAPVFESHQKNEGGNARIAETMFRYFRWPKHFDDFVYMSQVQQGLAIKTAVTHWRSLKPHCMGTLIWQLNDTWPVCSWASLDHGGDWKLLHHMARDFYAPVLVTAVPQDDALVLRAVNDTPQRCEVTVTAYGVNMHGTLRELGTDRAEVAENAVDVLRVAAHDLGQDELLHFEWSVSDGSTGSDTFAPRPYKDYDLIVPNLAYQVDGNVITITADALALFVAVEADVAGRFDDNAFALLPGQSKQVRFTPADPTDKPNFTLRDLHSATYA